MDSADIPLEVALSIVLAAAVDGADRRSLLAALSTPAELDADQAPALVFAFPARAGADPDDDGPHAA